NHQALVMLNQFKKHFVKHSNTVSLMSASRRKLHLMVADEVKRILTSTDHPQGNQCKVLYHLLNFGELR
ncbi:MAG: hypothetical protein ABIU85_11045, partial [Methylotenera sp.]